MSNYSLQAVATKVDDIENNPQRNTFISVASSTTLPTSSGVTQAIDSSYNGFIAVRSTALGTDSDEGPNPRTVISTNVNISTNRITVADHGLETGQTIRLSGTIPEGLAAETDYSANVIDAQTIEICTLGTTSAINITANISTSDSFLVKRDAFVAFDAEYWNNTSGTSMWLACVNFNFKYVSQAYRWFVKYAGTTKLIILASDHNTQNCFWSDTDPIHEGFYIGGGRNFEYLTQLQIWGYLGENPANPGTNLKIGGPVDGNGVPLSPTLNNMYCLDRCRMIITPGNDDNVPLWFRIFGSVYFQNVGFDFKIKPGTTAPLATCFRCSHGLFSFGNCAIIVWSANMMNNSTLYGDLSRDTSAFVALEKGTIYWLAGFGHIQGHVSLAVASDIGGGGTINMGTPNTSYLTFIPRTGTNGALGSISYVTVAAHRATSIETSMTFYHNGAISPSSYGNPSTQSMLYWT